MMIEQIERNRNKKDLPLHSLRYTIHLPLIYVNSRTHASGKRTRVTVTGIIDTIFLILCGHVTKLINSWYSSKIIAARNSKREICTNYNNSCF